MFEHGAFLHILFVTRIRAKELSVLFAPSVHQLGFCGDFSSVEGDGSVDDDDRGAALTLDAYDVSQGHSQIVSAPKADLETQDVTTPARRIGDAFVPLLEPSHPAARRMDDKPPPARRPDAYGNAVLAEPQIDAAHATVKSVMEVGTEERTYDGHGSSSKARIMASPAGYPNCLSVSKSFGALA